MNQKVVEELKKIDYEKLYNSYDSGAMFKVEGKCELCTEDK